VTFAACRAPGDTNRSRASAAGDPEGEAVARRHWADPCELLVLGDAVAVAIARPAAIDVCGVELPAGERRRDHGAKRGKKRTRRRGGERRSRDGAQRPVP
jgi:hypothetical protein